MKSHHSDYPVELLSECWEQNTLPLCELYCWMWTNVIPVAQCVLSECEGTAFVFFNTQRRRWGLLPNAPCFMRGYFTFPNFPLGTSSSKKPVDLNIKSWFRCPFEFGITCSWSTFPFSLYPLVKKRQFIKDCVNRISANFLLQRRSKFIVMMCCHLVLLVKDKLVELYSPREIHPSIRSLFRSSTLYIHKHALPRQWHHDLLS